MKKITTLLLAAGLVFSSVSGASAADLKVGGEFKFSFGAAEGMIGDNDTNHFEALQRVRLIFNYVASESLSGTVRLQLGNLGPNSAAAQWGSVADGANLAGSMDLKVNWAFLDWVIPGTEAKVRMGLQGLGGVVPAYVYNNVTGNKGTGVIATAPIANTDFTLGWVRANSDINEVSAENDIFFANAKVHLDGMEISPWFAYGVSGDNIYTPVRNYNQLMRGDLWMAGLGFQVTMFDPFTFAMDGYFSQIDNDHGDKVNGWYVDAALSYKTAYGTPALKGWYASGDKSDKGGQPGSFVGAEFDATSTMFDGAYGLNSTPDRLYAGGTYGVVLEWADLSFIDKLSHTARVAYVQGTNNDHGIMRKDNMTGEVFYMTTKDHFVEADLETTYQVYKNLAAVFELAYVFNDIESFNKGDDISRASLTFAYNF